MCAASVLRWSGPCFGVCLKSRQFLSAGCGLAGVAVEVSEELQLWFDVMLNGSPNPPRRRPREHVTIRVQLR
jgi:hypothetical protein